MKNFAETHSGAWKVARRSVQTCCVTIYDKLFWQAVYLPQWHLTFDCRSYCKYLKHLKSGDFGEKVLQGWRTQAGWFFLIRVIWPVAFQNSLWTIKHWLWLFLLTVLDQIGRTEPGPNFHLEIKAIVSAQCLPGVDDKSCFVVVRTRVLFLLHDSSIAVSRFPVTICNNCSCPGSGRTECRCFSGHTYNLQQALLI